MIKAVLDTTVLIAAMLRPEPEGVSAELLKLVAEGATRIC
jgi:predicted nucleic acid-binding protein